MTKYLKGAVLLLSLITVPSLVAAAGYENLSSDSRVLCQLLINIEAKQDKILQNQEKIKKALALMSRGAKYHETENTVERALK